MKKSKRQTALANAAPIKCALVKRAVLSEGPSKDTHQNYLSLLQLPSPPLPLIQDHWCLASQIRQDHQSQGGLIQSLPHALLPLTPLLRPRTPECRSEVLLYLSLPSLVQGLSFAFPRGTLRLEGDFHFMTSNLTALLNGPRVFSRVQKGCLCP